MGLSRRYAWSVHALLAMLLHPGLNHLDGRSIDVALVEGDLEVVPRLGYLNRTSSLSWLAVIFFSLSRRYWGCWISYLPVDFFWLLSDSFPGLYPCHCFIECCTGCQIWWIKQHGHRPTGERNSSLAGARRDAADNVITRLLFKQWVRAPRGWIISSPAIIYGLSCDTLQQFRLFSYLSVNN